MNRESWKLVIANKAYSSWSLRPWLVLKHAGIPFEEIKISLRQSDTAEKIARFSASGKVPVLIDGDLRIWESLAICETIAEAWPEKKLWPEDPSARAVARAVSSEMHAGFQDLRQHMPMNARRHYPGQGMTPEVGRDIQRITELWEDCRSRFGKGGDFLFGRFSIADAMFAPVCVRFTAYDPPLETSARAYVKTIMHLPAMAEWVKAAREEKEVIDAYEKA